MPVAGRLLVLLAFALVGCDLVTGGVSAGGFQVRNYVDDDGHAYHSSLDLIRSSLRFQRTDDGKHICERPFVGRYHFQPRDG